MGSSNLNASRISHSSWNQRRLEIRALDVVDEAFRAADAPLDAPHPRDLLPEGVEFPGGLNHW
jgi:hypothetical protein